MEKPINNQPKIPTGVRLLSFFNIICLGFFWLAASLSGFTKTEKIVETLNETLRQQGITDVHLAVWQVQMVSLLQGVVAIFFIITGTFLLRKKEWARKAVVRFCLFIAGFLCLGALSMPGLIGPAIINVIHPGICILYLTGAKAVEWFNDDNATQPPNPTCCT
jgi:hypothetical protein